MTGKDILEALSNVDARYIEEAENGKLRKVSPVRYFLPLAACLCLIVTALRFLPRQPETAVDENAEVMQETMLDSQTEIVIQEKDESFHEEPELVWEEVEEPNASEVPMVILRIEKWTDEGFTASIIEHLEAEFAPLGTVLNVKWGPNMVVETVSGGLVNAERRSPTEADFPVGTLVRVRYQFFTEEDTITLHIGSICEEGE